MKNKKRLISLMLAGTIATSTMGLVGCSDLVLNAGSLNREHFNIETSLDAGVQITNVLSYNLILDGQKYYLELFGHYDEGCVENSTTRSKSYTNHKDYIVTYEISQDEYRKVAKFYDNSKNDIKYITGDNLAVLQDIIDTHDPINVEENTIDNDGLDNHRD